MNLTPSSRVISRSTICSWVWPVISAPHSGQCGIADPRPEQAQVVVDLGHRADGRARVARGRLLVDRDRRREALDRVDVGLLHQTEELPCVGRERLDVAPLPLGVDRVEGEARLARPREPRDHDQRIARQLDVDVLEIVLPGTRDDDPIRSGHCDTHPNAGEQMFPGENPADFALSPCMRNETRSHRRLARPCREAAWSRVNGQLCELGYSKAAISRQSMRDDSILIHHVRIRRRAPCDFAAWPVPGGGAQLWRRSTTEP